MAAKSSSKASPAASAGAAAPASVPASAATCGSPAGAGAASASTAVAASATSMPEAFPSAAAAGATTSCGVSGAPAAGAWLAQPPASSSAASAAVQRISAMARSVAAIAAGGARGAVAQVGGDLGDRLLPQRRVELAAEGLHVGHAFDHHVEDLPAAVVADQVVHRHRRAVVAQQLGGDLDAAAARQRGLALQTHPRLALEVEQGRAVALHQVVDHGVGEQLDVGVAGAAAVRAQHQP